MPSSSFQIINIQTIFQNESENEHFKILIFSQKRSFSWTSLLFGRKWWKMEEIKNCWTKKISLVGIVLECFRTYFQTKISLSNFSSGNDFFLGVNHFLAKNLRKSCTVQNFWMNLFLSESMLNISKHISIQTF